MAEDRVDMPTTFIERLRSDRRLQAAVAGGALVVIALIVIAALALLGDSGPDSGGPAGLPGLDGGVDADQGDGSESSDSSTRTTGAEGEDPAPDDPSEPPAERPGRAARVAYRLDDALWVADENGDNAVRVVGSARGDFELSPDATVLAWIDGESHGLHLTRVADGSDIVVGSAEDVHPAWSPDSQFVTYTAQSPTRLEVRRVTRDGRGDTFVGAGHSGSVSPDGRSVAFVSGTTPGAAAPLVVRELGGASVTLSSIVGSEVAFGGDGLVYCAPGSSTGTHRIMTAGLDGSDPREVLDGSALDDRPTMCGRLRISPNGASLLFATFGDDGFSRALITPIDDPDVVSLSVRRDTYPVCWSADGSRVFFVEGNAFQGEDTSLMKAFPDGFGRAVVVEGAGL